MRTINLFVLTEANKEFSRGILRGLALYKYSRDHVFIHLCPHDYAPSENALSKMENICAIARPDVIRERQWLRGSKIPLIYIDSFQNWVDDPDPNIVGTLEADADSIVRMAVEHYLNQGYESFAFVGAEYLHWSFKRERALRKFLSERDYRLESYIEGDTTNQNGYGGLIQWLRSLPKPVGLMACDDNFGRRVLLACREGGMRAPEEVAIIGVDNDPIICELCAPTLSSISLNVVEASYNAVAHLDALVQSGASPSDFGRESFRAFATGLAARGSTLKSKFRDFDVDSAYQYIQRAGNAPISVGQVAARVGMSVRSLQRKFKLHTGKTLSETIEAVRMRDVKAYLAETDFSIKQIARKTGFPSASYFAAYFKKREGITPSRYRLQKRENPF